MTNESDEIVARFPNEYPDDLRLRIAERLRQEIAGGVAATFKGDWAGASPVVFLLGWNASLTPALYCMRTVVVFAVESAIAASSHEERRR